MLIALFSCYNIFVIKLLATDLDGTLFYPKRYLSLIDKSNKKFLIDFHSAGGKVVLITGRDYRLPLKVSKKCNIDLAIIGCNGGFIYENHKFIKSKPIPREILFDCYLNLKANYDVLGFLVFDDTPNLKVSVVRKDSLIPYAGVFINLFSMAYKEKYIVSERQLVSAIAKGKVFKLQPIVGISKSAKKKASEISFALKDKYKDKLTISATSIGLEITSIKANKAITLKEYIKLNNIKEDEVAIVGDSENDIPLFDNFINSFAMANGDERVLKLAKHIVNKVSDIRPFVLDKDNKLIK